MNISTPLNLVPLTATNFFHFILHNQALRISIEGCPELIIPLERGKTGLTLLPRYPTHTTTQRRKKVKNEKRKTKMGKGKNGKGEKPGFGLSSYK